jgi:hypothetical protein
MITKKSIKLQPGENQHLRLKLDQIKRDYSDGLLTASGLLYYAIGVMRAPGQELVLTVAQWLELTGLKERTFYKAKAKLVAQGKLAEKVEGFITLKYESSVVDLSEKQSKKDADSTESSDCPIVQNDCPNGQPERPIVQNDCPNGQPERPIVQNDCPNGQVERPIVQNERSKPMTSLGSILSSDITNVANTPNQEEGGKIRNFEEKKEGQDLPEEILAKMARLKILGGDRDSKVLEVCTSGQFNLTQVKGALDHVSKTWYSCENPAAVFLYQLPRQPRQAVKQKTERDKLRAPLFVAHENQIPITELYGRHSSSWEEAARHFGHSEEAIAKFKQSLSSRK